MKKKKILLTFGSLMVAALPVSFVVSCGSSWQAWSENRSQHNPTQDPNITNISSISTSNNASVLVPETKNTKVSEAQYATGNLASLSSAYDKVTNTIDLEKVTNQFQVNMILIDLLNLKPTDNKSIDDFWKSTEWPKFIDYINGIKDQLTITVKYKSQSFVVNWDFSTIKQSITSWLSLATDHLLDIESHPDWLDAKGNLTSEAQTNAAAAVTDTRKFDSNHIINNIPIVLSLQKVDVAYALSRLTLLTNLPTEAFKNIVDMLKVIDALASSVWAIDNDGYYSQATMKEWQKDQSIIPGLQVLSAHRNSDNTIDGKEFTNSKGVSEASLLLQALSNKYKEVSL